MGRLGRGRLVRDLPGVLSHKDAAFVPTGQGEHHWGGRASIVCPHSPRTCRRGAGSCWQLFRLPEHHRCLHPGFTLSLCHMLVTDLLSLPLLSPSSSLLSPRRRQWLSGHPSATRKRNECDNLITRSCTQTQWLLICCLCPA